MHQWLRRTAVVAALSMPASAAIAQAPQQPPAEVQQWIAEIQQIQTQLRPVQEQALQDSALQQEQAQVADAVRQAIIEADSSMASKMERLETLATEARAAQEAGDTQKIAKLTGEAQTLQPEIYEAQAEALEKPEIEVQVSAFQENLHERMAQLDPKAKPLIDKMKQLDERVRKAMGAG
jgi:hypothetical protein